MFFHDNYAFMSTARNGEQPPQGRWSKGKSYDGRGQFTTTDQPGATVPDLGPALPKTGVQEEQVQGSKGTR